MSTFKGIMGEFPNLRVDCFRDPLDYAGPPMLAGFLSHIHSDHLAGLESWKKNAFIYCSAATRQMLLKLQRRTARINFATGLLEAPKLTYKHLDTLLKPVPLDTPVKIVLSNGHTIQVTFFDANHCPGAVMMLFEDEQRAVLYTGDMRAEPSFVTQLMANPLMVEYTSGLRILDCIYLDTSHTTPLSFPTKRDGILELLQKIKQYPPHTVFHFAAWTYGYEDVWLALAKALDSSIHVDKYKLGVFRSLVERGRTSTKHNSATRTTLEVFAALEAPAIVGFSLGNASIEGILTEDITARLHSCEKGSGCSTVENQKDIVWIRPIITRTPSGQDVEEIGIGGGLEDLSGQSDFEIEIDGAMLSQVLDYLERKWGVMDERVDGIRELTQSRSVVRFLWEDLEIDDAADDIDVEDFGTKLVNAVARKQERRMTDDQLRSSGSKGMIKFPFSRHSSYEELCAFVQIFKPKEVWPCTVNEANWREDQSMQTLFGHYVQRVSCSIMRHDVQMRSKLRKNRHGARPDKSQEVRRTPSPGLDNDTIYSPCLRSGNKSRHQSQTVSHGLRNSAADVASIRPETPANADEVAGGERPPKRACLNKSEEVASQLLAHQDNRTGSPVIVDISDDDEDSDDVDFNDDIYGDIASNGVSDTEDCIPAWKRATLPPLCEYVYWDPMDCVMRCQACHWEWDEVSGACTGMAYGEESEELHGKPGDICTIQGPKATEVYDVYDVDPETGVRIFACRSEDAKRFPWSDVLKEDVQDLIEEYAIFDSEAEIYAGSEADTKGDEDELEGSFIDDGPMDSDQSTDHQDSDGLPDDDTEPGGDDPLDDDIEPGSDDSSEASSNRLRQPVLDYKARYEAEVAKNTALTVAYNTLDEEFRAFRYEMDVLLTDDDVGDAIDEDGDGLRFVEVAKPPDNVVIDVDSQLLLDSQYERVSPARLADRQAAFEGAWNDNGWRTELESVAASRRRRAVSQQL